MPLSSFWEALGGLGFFLLGMKALSEGLQKLAGDRLRQSLEKITGNRLTAALVGSCLASLLQSSSTASILVIGFINAGLISLYQALGVLLGTGIGATLAIQFIAFNVTSFALPAIFFGVVLRYFVRSRRWANAGYLLLGAGLVFWGLAMMESGFVPLRQTTLFQGIHSHFLTWRVNAALLGALLTFLIQSSSASAGIVIAVTGSGLVSFEEGAAMMIGEVMGTSLIAVVASINGTMAAKRTTVIFLVMNAVAIFLVLLFFPYFLSLVKLLTPGAGELMSGAGLGPRNPALFRSLANAHTAFSLMKALFFLPMIGFFARSAAVILPDRKGEADIEPRSKFIDMRVINTPTIALLQAKNEVKRMAEICHGMYNDVTEQMYSFDVKRSARIRQKEEVLDVLQRDIASFLVVLSRQPYNSFNSMELPILIHIVNNLEHIGDQSEALLDCLQRKKEQNIHFSDTAMDELKELAAKAGEILSVSLDSLGDSSEGDVQKARLLKDAILAHVEMMNNHHIERLTAGICTVIAGVIYSDILSAFVKISEYAFNVTKAEKELD